MRITIAIIAPIRYNRIDNRLVMRIWRFTEHRNGVESNYGTITNAF
jgi:hypothetical protein